MAMGIAMEMKVAAIVCRIAHAAALVSLRPEKANASKIIYLFFILFLFFFTIFKYPHSLQGIWGVNWQELSAGEHIYRNTGLRLR